MRIFAVLILLSFLPPNLPARAASGVPAESDLVGSWMCVTTKDHAYSHLTFKRDGTVVGRSAHKALSGTYALRDGNLSIVAGDQFIAASSVRIGGTVARAMLVNGDSVTCHRAR
jgi:hypothetical protein